MTKYSSINLMGRKHKKVIVKKLFCILFCILLGVDSLAAVVSDNDGAAFVTKREFETLKENFAEQITNYNSSIDNKIDGAIASYLAGIKIDNAPTNLIESYETTIGKKQTWLYALPGNGSSTNNIDLMQTIDCELCINRINNISIRMCKWDGAADQLSYFITAVVYPSTTWSDRYAFQTYYAEQRPSGTQGIGLKHYPTGNITTETAYRDTSKATYANFPQNTSVLSHPREGSGSGWLWQDFGNNKKTLKYYCTDLYPSFNLLWQLHYYKYFPATTNAYYLNSSGLTITDLSMTQNPTLESAWGATVNVGTKATSKTDTNLRNYAELSSSLVRTSDGNNYLDTVWGIDNTTMIYGNDEDVVPTLDDTELELEISSDVKYSNQAYQLEGFKTFETSYPNVKQKVKLRNYEMKHLSLSNFCNNTLSNIASELVYNGNGAPCYYCQDTDMVNTGKIKLITSSGTCNCNIKISDKPFNNGEIVSGANTILDLNVETGTEYSFALNNTKVGNYYMFIKNNTNTNPITIDLFEIK